MYTRQDPCPIEEALRALAQAVDDEMVRDQSNGAAETEIGDTSRAAETEIGDMC